MPRFAFTLEYDGGPFAGWQRQKDQPSVQAALEQALRVLEPGVGSTAAAGRTDAGVHARGQVAHADLSRDWDPYELGEALNHHLKPNPVAILSCARVADDWHARFTAIGRRYTYRVLCRRAPPVLESGRVWAVRHPVSVAPMQAAARHLLGKHDFTTFRSSICQAKSPVKTLDLADVELSDTPAGPEIHFHFAARSFLHNQVRSFVGTLMKVGNGSWPPDRVAEILEARDRAACGPVAPPEGLYLMGVDYPEDPFADG